jgi:hypothetical protein
MEIADQTRRYPFAGAATKHPRDFAGVAEGQPKTTQPSAILDPATGGNLLRFPTGQHMETIMSGHGDDAGHCSNGLSAQKFRAGTPEQSTIYRRWIFGMVAFYTTLLLISGVVAITVDSMSNSTKFTAASTQRAVGSHGTN